MRMSLEREKIISEQKKKPRRLEDVVEMLKKENSREEIERLTKEVYTLIKIKFLEAGGVFYDDVSKFYKNLKGDFVVRVENPEVVIDSVIKRDDYEILPKGNYPNAVEWRSDYGLRGLRDAFMEGTGMLGGLVSLVGFKEGKDIEVSDVSAEEKDMFGRERGLVRVAKGTVHPRDVQFVILRLPVSYFPEGELTEREKKDIQKFNPPYLFRGFAFNESAEAGKEERVAA